MSVFSRRLGAALVSLCACAVAACAPGLPWNRTPGDLNSPVGAAPHHPGSGEVAAGSSSPAQVPSLRGRIESMPRRIAALTTDIAAGATVALIDPENGRTVATTVSDTDGFFDVQFPSSFVPAAGKPYYLEAVKGLPLGDKPNRAGAAIARVRTLVTFAITWSSLSGSGIVISRGSTAVAIVAAYRSLTQANLVALGGRLSDTTFNAQGTAIPQEDYDRVFALVSDAIYEDQDPVEAVAYDPAGASAALRFGRRTAGVVIHDAVSPAVPARNATITVKGQNLPGPGPATPSVTIGGATVTSWTVNATRTQLTAQVPGAAVSGFLEVTQGSTTWTGPLVPVAGTTGTLAGGSGRGWLDGPGMLAKFDTPHGITFDNAGNLYVSEWYGHRIRKISPHGVVTTIAGDGTAGGNDGTGLGARFSSPRHLARDAQGSIYVADWGNLRIRKISPAGSVSTLTAAGTFAQNPASPYNMAGNPSSVAFDPAGNLFFAEYTNHRIWKMTTAGVFSVFAGNGVSSYTDGTGPTARLSYPDGMVWGGDGFLYSANNGQNHLKKISAAGVSTTLNTNGNFVANGPSVAQNAVWWVARSPSGDVYSSYSNYVDKPVAGTGVVTVSGAPGVTGYIDGLNADARFGATTMGGTVDANGVIYVVDQENNVIRVVAP